MNTIRRIAALGVFATILAAASMNCMAQSGLRMHVPFLPDTPSWQTFIRLVGAANRTTTFTFRLFSTDGTPAGRYVYRVPRTRLGAAHHVNGDQFKQQGAPRGPWSAFIDMVPAGLSTPAVYLRTAAGFVTPIHNTGEWIPRSAASNFSETLGASITYGEYQWTLNPGRNRQQVGMLHVTTIGQAGEVFILAFDDTGERLAVARTGQIPAFTRRTYTSAEMEQVSGMTGAGKWRLILLGTADFSSQTGIWARDVNIYAASSPQTENSWEITSSASIAAAMAEEIPPGELVEVSSELSYESADMYAREPSASDSSEMAAHSEEIDTESLPASCIKFRLIHVFTARNTGLSGRSSVWLMFTASEDKPHAVFLNLVQNHTESVVKRM